jgi:hypothetical protein
VLKDLKEHKAPRVLRVQRVLRVPIAYWEFLAHKE